MNHELIARIVKIIGSAVTTVTSFDEDEGRFCYGIQFKDISVTSDTTEDALGQFIQRVQAMRLTRAEHAEVDRALGQEEEEAERRRKEDRRSVPGVADLEDLLGSEVGLIEDMDEDGPSGLVRATIVIGGEVRVAGHGATATEAVSALRRNVASVLRRIAGDLESPEE